MTPVPCSPLTQHLIVFGGTFDPPHEGHVQLTSAARDVIDAKASLLFIPAAVSPFKVGLAATPAEHRAAMLRLAIAPLRDAYMWTDEIDRAKLSSTTPSFTIDTITRLQSQLSNARITLLIGADQAASFHKWRDATQLLPHVRVLLRDPHTEADSLLSALRATEVWTSDQLTTWHNSTLLLPLALHPARSTDIRQRIAATSIDSVPPNWLNPAVAQYIITHNLYH